MKVRVLMIVASAALFLVPKSAGADEPAGQPGGMSGHAVMQQNADESAQATTDMSLGQGWRPGEPAAQRTGYGGVAAGQSQAGGRHSPPCTVDAACKVYFGQ